MTQNEAAKHGFNAGVAIASNNQEGYDFLRDWFSGAIAQESDRRSLQHGFYEGYTAGLNAVVEGAIAAYDIENSPDDYNPELDGDDPRSFGFLG